MYLVPGYLYNRLRSVLDNDENRELTNLNKIQSSKNKEENVANVNSNTSDLSMTTNVLDSIPKPSDQSKQTEVKQDQTDLTLSAISPIVSKDTKRYQPHNFTPFYERNGSWYSCKLCSKKIRGKDKFEEHYKKEHSVQNETQQKESSPMPIKKIKLEDNSKDLLHTTSKTPKKKVYTKYTS
jgi:hypothetical protein